MKNENFSFGMAFLIMPPYILSSSLFSLFGQILTDSVGKELSSFTTLDFLTIYLFDFTGTFLVIWLFTKYVLKENLSSLGFKTQNRLLEFLLSIIIGALVMLFGYFILFLSEEIKLENYNINFSKIIYLTILFAFVSISEEVFFRGYILRNLMASFNKYIALVISSVLFAVLHLGNPNMGLIPLFGLFLGGLLLGVSYIYTKNLWFPIGLHLSWNLFQSLFGFNVSGINMYSMIEFSIKDNNILNGGNFGFEGSILSTVSTTILILAIIVYYEKIHKPFKVN